MANKNEIMMNPGAVYIFNDPKIGEQYTSFSPTELDGQKKLYNAINAPDDRLANYINTPIEMSDVILTKVKLAPQVNRDNKDWTDETDQEREGIRVIIIDKDGKSHTATSTGIYNSICTMRSVFGTLHFDPPMKVVVKQIKTKNGTTLTLSLAD